ncbi:adenylate/guanylate cyclase domain-containing protein [Pseudonocardia sp. GCM10023141]|uniref:adenylate/guanylate cyclase domain-containing protein n=1 Tax=Pseudonocardia sp. GCM10023141 TaxID=3252653 RepID=UPI003607EDB0
MTADSLAAGSPAAAAPATVPAADRSGRARLALWTFHLALPMAGLYLLLAVPAADVRIEHHPTHFWLVIAAAALNIGLAEQVNRGARAHRDARLTLVGLGFLAAALFLGLHALATPGILIDSSNGGFALATPVGLLLAALCSAVSTVDLDGPRGAAVLAACRWLRWVLIAFGAVWAAVSLSGLPPLANPAVGEPGSPALIAMVVVTVPLYVLAAVRYFRLYRRRRSVVLLSVLTADALLAEAMIAVALGVSWQLTWWLWHVLMVIAFGYVAYSAYVTYRREGISGGLFDAVGSEQTLRRVRAEYSSALEALVAAVQRQEAGELTAREMTLITAGLARRFGLSEGQTAVLGRAAAALRDEREQIGRLDVLVAIGHESRVRHSEQDLLGIAVRRLAGGFGGDGVRVGLLTEGTLEFPPQLCTDPGWSLGPSAARDLERSLGGMAAFEVAGTVLACPLSVKERPVGMLLARRYTGFTARDRSMIASLASQLSIGLENARLYHQLDGLFRQYMSPDVATQLIADPSQAALGGAVVPVTAVFADLRGFTTFSERSTPEEIVAMLNRYFEQATEAILAEGGTVVQFVGDAMMALFNAPVRQPDHALRAARAALAMQRRVEHVAEPGWPQFRIGINTGPALVGNIGSTALRNFNAMGDAVNVAARLESVAQPGQVVIGEDTRVLLPASARTESLGVLAVKGREQGVGAHVLLGLD